MPWIYLTQRDNDLTQSRVDFCFAILALYVWPAINVRYSSLRDQLKDDLYTQTLWSDVPIIQTFQGDKNQSYFSTENIEMELELDEKMQKSLPHPSFLTNIWQVKNRRMQDKVNRFYRSFLTLHLEDLSVWTLTPATRIFAHILLVCRINKQLPCNDSETELSKQNKEIL